MVGHRGLDFAAHDGGARCTDWFGCEGDFLRFNSRPGFSAWRCCSSLILATVVLLLSGHISETTAAKLFGGALGKIPRLDAWVSKQGKAK